MNLESLVTKDYLATRFAEQQSAINARFEQVNARFSEQDAKINANFRILFWMIGIVQVFVILPFAERLLTL